MCKKKPGIRCSGDVGKCLDDISEALAKNKALADEAKVAIFNVETEEEAEVIVAEMDRLETERALLEGRKVEAQDAYDMTKRGREELQAAMDDDNLTELERKRLNARYEKAVAGWEAHRNQRVRNAIDVANVSHLLRESGVDEETIADIAADITNEHGLPHPRSIADYQAQLVTAEARYKAINTQANRAAKEAKDKALNKGLSDEQAEVAAKKAKAKYSARWKKADARLKEVKFAIDSTEEGQKSLREQIAAVAPEKFKDRAELKVRLMAVAKSRADGLSDRRNRQRYKDKIKAALKAAGKDPKILKEVLGAPEVLAGEPKLYPHELRTTVKSHFAFADQGKVNSLFQTSPEFKAGGEDAFNDYAVRRILADPRVGLSAKAVAEANAKAEIGFDNRPHRHFTTSAGARQARIDVKLTRAQEAVIKDRAASLHMSASSYVNRQLLGLSPFAIQNDRSKANWRKKNRAVRAMLAEMESAAA